MTHPLVELPSLPGTAVTLFLGRNLLARPASKRKTLLRSPTRKEQPMRYSTCAFIVLLIVTCVASPNEAREVPPTQPTTQPVKEIQIDMDKAVDLPLPDVTADLQPKTF